MLNLSFSAYCRPLKETHRCGFPKASKAKFEELYADYADGTHEYPGEGDDGQSLTEHEEHEQHGQHPAHHGAVYVVTWDTCCN